MESLKGYKISEIRGGNHHSVACTEDQKLLVWGRCDDSQMGIELDEVPKEVIVRNAQGAPSILAQATVIPGKPNPVSYLNFLPQS